MRISVEVVSDKGNFWPGTAHVSLDGKLIAKLRGGEGIEITTAEQVETRSTTPPRSEAA